jgi:hypothetical protein
MHEKQKLAILEEIQIETSPLVIVVSLSEDAYDGRNRKGVVLPSYSGHIFKFSLDNAYSK